MNHIGKVLVCIACILFAGSANFAYSQNIGGVRPEVPKNLEDSLKKQIVFLGNGMNSLADFSIREDICKNRQTL